MEQNQYEKRGYLNEEFKVFYVEDIVSKEIEYHYHDFDKILVFFKGKIEYTIEGKSYTLIPNDIVLVPQGASHKVMPVADTGDNRTEYVRLVIYISPQYLLQAEENGQNLRDCFLHVKNRYSNVVRLQAKGEEPLIHLAKQLKESVLDKDTKALGGLYQNALLQQFMVLLNRKMEDESLHFVDTSKCNRKMVEIIRYVNEHLTGEISIDMIAEKFYISKYHMMRQFKEATGYTIGNYISQKRLLMARELLKKGETVTKVYLDCGFRDHSTFVRAYKQLFGEVPSKRGM